MIPITPPHWPQVGAHAMLRGKYRGAYSTSDGAAESQANGARVFVRGNAERMEREDAGSVLSLKQAGWSIAFFLKLTDPSGVQIPVSKDDVNIARNFVFYTLDSDLFFFSTSDQATVGTLTTNQFHFISAWLDPADDKLYASLDNAAASASAGAVTAVSNTGKFILGNAQPAEAGAHCSMHIAKIVMSDRKWTDAERTWLYNSGAGRAYHEFGDAGDGSDMLTNLVAYWPANEASGNMIDLHADLDLTDVNTVGAATGPP